MYPANLVLILLFMVSSTLGCLPNKYQQFLRDFKKSALDALAEQEPLTLDGGAWVAEGHDVQFRCPNDDKPGTDLLVWYYYDAEIGFCRQTDNRTWTTFTKKCTCSITYSESACYLNIMNVSDGLTGLYTCEKPQLGVMVIQRRYKLITGNETVF